MAHQRVSSLIVGILGLSTMFAMGEVVIKDGDSIAFMGDSLTQLGYVHKPNGYIHLVIEGLKQAGVNAVPIPAGVGGNTSRDMLARLEKDVIARKPVWMTLNCGINDSPKLSVEEFRSNITAIVDRTMAAGIKVVLMNTTIGAGESIGSAESLKRLKFCEEFTKLAELRKLILVDLNGLMTRELTERKKDGAKGFMLTYDGTHLNGIGNQIMAAEILKALGVSEGDVAVMRQRWNDYPFAAGMPEVSINDYLKLKTGAGKSGKSVDEKVSSILTDGKMKVDKSQVPVKSKVMQSWDDDLFHSNESVIKDGEQIAILSGQSFEGWSWSPSGYMRLLTDELARRGIKKNLWIYYEGQKTAQMLERLDQDVIAKKPVYVLIIPGSADYNPFAEKNVSATFTNNLTTLIERLQAAKIHTILVTSYAVNSNVQFPANPNVADHNAAIQALAKGFGLTLIDFVKVVKEEKSPVPFDGSPAAKALVNQMLAGEVLRAIGYGDKAVAACRAAWLDRPGAIQFMPSVSVNSYEKLKDAASASGKEVGPYMAELLKASLNY